MQSNTNVEESAYDLEIALTGLTRQINGAERDRRTYSEESCNLIKRQQKEINTLLAESAQMKKLLELTTCNQNMRGDERDAIQLHENISTIEQLRRNITDEESEVKLLEKEITSHREEIVHERRLFNNDPKNCSESNIMKRLRITESRLDQEMVKFNSQLAKNTKLRTYLDNLRHEKSVMDNIFKKLSTKLQDGKKHIREYMVQATRAYEERDEAQTKMIAHKERSEKDNAQQEIDMKELMRIIRHDDKLKEFMGIKVNERIELREEEIAKKAKGKDGSLEFKNDKAAIESFETSLDNIKKDTGLEDIDTIVEGFITKEEENFALYNYVKELSDTVDGVQDEINDMQNEMQKLNENDEKNEEHRHKMIKEMEITADRLNMETDEVEKKSVEINKSLDEIRGNVVTLFKTAECDASSISAMLGGEDGVTNKNIMQYMGLIEQRTMELLKIQQYLQMLRELPKVKERKDKTQAAAPVPVVNRKPTGPLISIIPPSTTDDEDLLEDELRPLTRLEIKTMVMRTINTKIVNSEYAKKNPPPKRPNKRVDSPAQ